MKSEMDGWGLSVVMSPKSWFVIHSSILALVLISSFFLPPIELSVF